MPTKKTSAQRRILNLLPSRNTERDWTASDALSSQSAAAAPAALPASVDLRAPWWNINDQGNTGSCVGWATADGIARYHMVKAGKIPQPGLLSARMIWMGSKETDPFTNYPETFIEDAGTTLKAAVDILRKHGVVPEPTLPFKINTLMYAGGNSNTFFALAAQRKATAYFNLLKNPGNWRQWLATQGPILAGLNVDATWDNAAATQGKLDVFQPATARGGHAVCVVGYRTDGRFIIRNSWGTSWGDKGFGYASVAYINAAFFNESYGITV